MSKLQPLRLALAQINPTVGDIAGNVAKIRDQIMAARKKGAKLVVFPELATCGYPPEDLLLKTHFLQANRRAIDEIAADTANVTGLVVLVGFPEGAGGGVYNSLAVLTRGELRTVYRKMRLPNYGVFDEHRYFKEGTSADMVVVVGRYVGLTVCEDIWEPGPPATAQARAGATLIANASASPYHHGKAAEREEMIASRAKATGAVMIYCNLVGGQDELVFDGHSMVIDRNGQIMARAPQFAEALLFCDLDPAVRPAGRVAPLLEENEEIYRALVLGLHDYVDKNGFERVALGLSGGIDSALVALIALDALGPERVVAAIMPSPHSSPATQADARAIAANLGIEAIELAIEPAMEVYQATLAPAFKGVESGIAEENLQARIRGNLLMALSNKFGWLVLTTGNKSEMSVGYSTLYGDMAGGFAVIKDVLKTRVYELVRHRCAQAGNELIPPSVIDRPPSAELRPDQTDQDSLPPYEVLDRIIQAYVEEDQGVEAIVAAEGLAADLVADVIAKVDRAEYKRRQAPPGIKITEKAFGRDRRLPITNRFGD